MILLPFLEYGEHRDLDIAITVFVNNILGEIVQTIIEVHEDRKSLNDSASMSLLRDISPATMFRENPKRCENTLFELYELICSELPQKKLVPRYRLFLFQCIECYIDFLCGDEEFLFRVLPEPLRQAVLQEYGSDVVTSLENLSDYTEICFDDWDFLPRCLHDIVGLYLMQNFSFFEIAEAQAPMVIKALNKTTANGRRVIVEVAGENNGKSDKSGKKQKNATAKPAEKKGKKGSKADKSTAGTRPSREERGYTSPRGPKKKDDWKQFFVHDDRPLKGEEPDFMAEQWAKPMKRKK